VKVRKRPASRTRALGYNGRLGTVQEMNGTLTDLRDIDELIELVDRQMACIGQIAPFRAYRECGSFAPTTGPPPEDGRFRVGPRAARP
jgi:hypothetical protein